MEEVIYVVSLPLVYGVIYVLLQMLSNMAIWVGNLLNKSLHRPPAPDKNMWLFSMLMGVTRFPTIILGIIAYFFFLMGYMSGNPLYTVAESFAILCFGTFLVIRLFCLLIGGVLFGDSIKGILRSLSS